MSKASEVRSEQRRSADAAGPDLDAEHDPDVARRASRAGLHKAAGKAEPSSATTEERTAQRDQSNHSSVSGLEAAVGVASKQLMVHADRIETLAGTPATEAGQEPLRQAITAGVSAVTETVTSLSGNVELAASAHVPVDQLKHVLAVFDRAYGHFTDITTKVSMALSPHKGEVYALPQGTTQLLDRMYQAAGLVVAGGRALGLAKPGDFGALRETPESKAIASALDAMLIAATDSIQLARMSVAGVADDTRERDFERASGHVRELAALLKRADPRTVHAHKQKLRAVAHGMDRLFEEEAARPGPKEMFKNMVERASVARNSAAEIAKAAQ